MKIRYKFRFYPTPSQEQVLARTFGCVRFVYNWGLRTRSDAHRNGKKVGYHKSSALLTKLKRNKDFLWLNEVSCVPEQQALRHLNTSFINFFEKRSGYPSFKSKRGVQTAEYTKSAFKWDPENRNLVIAKVGSEETLAGKIVLSVGVMLHQGDEPISSDDPVKADLDELHLRKIDLADEILFLSVDGYIGESTSREIAYAAKNGKPVRYA